MMAFEGCSHSLCSAELGNHYFPVTLINIMATPLHKSLHQIQDPGRNVETKCRGSENSFVSCVGLLSFMIRPSVGEKGVSV